MQAIYNKIISEQAQNKKSFAVLIDPDATNEAALLTIVEKCEEASVDYILVGGSLITNGYFDRCIALIKSKTKIPCIIFPGNTFQISPKADALLFLSLISGRNPELLIGNHVLSAALLKHSKIEVIPTGYMLVDGGRMTSVSYMSNTIPIPADKFAIASSTALAGEMLGMKLIYLDAGSGALQPVPARMISEVKKEITLPIIVGGGIRTKDNAITACLAGADIIVVGNALEKDTSLIREISLAIHQL